MGWTRRLSLPTWAKQGAVKVAAAVAVVPFTAGAGYLVNKYLLNPPKPEIQSVSAVVFRAPLTLDDQIKTLLQRDAPLAGKIQDAIEKLSNTKCRSGMVVSALALTSSAPLWIRVECIDDIQSAVGSVAESLQREINELKASSTARSSAQVKAVQARLANAWAVWRKIHALKDASSPIEDAEIEAVVVNKGNSDTLISDSAILQNGDIKVPLAVSSGSPISLKSQSTATVVFSTKDQLPDSQEKWADFLRTPRHQKFDLVLTVNGRQLRAPGELY